MITLTDKAAQHVSHYLIRRGRSVDLRVGVETTSCSDLAYKFEYIDEIAIEDQVFESNSVKVIVDPESLPYIDGIKLDYTRGGLSEGFHFSNPSVKDECDYDESLRM